MLRLDGRVVADKIRASLTQKIGQWTAQHQVVPGLAVVLVGHHEPSEIYVRNKKRACEKVGIRFELHRLPQTTNTLEVQNLIQKLNREPQVHGILVQLPLPSQVDSFSVLETIDVTKDADGLTSKSMGLLLKGHALAQACTPMGVMSILEHYQIPVSGLKAVVVGRSQIVGTPMATLLTQKNATVTLCHSKTRDLANILKTADLVVVAAGKKQFLDSSCFKKDAIVIDVGMHVLDSGEFVGDVLPQNCEQVLSAMTPVPGGVGPMTITSLLQNVFQLAQYSEQRD